MPRRAKRKLPETHPHLVEEWDHGRNDIEPDGVTYGSHKRVWWKCLKCGYGWESFVYNRGCYGHSCPSCSGNVVSDKNNLSNRFPSIALEWDYEKNDSLPGDFSYGSEKVVWWVCSKCSYNWKSSINNRTNKEHRRGCPLCARKVITKENSLRALFPELIKEWDFQRNIVSPDDVLPGSGKKVWWVCRACGHNWSASVSHRTQPKPTSCPACAGRAVTDKNNLAVRYPDIALEWCYSRNGDLVPEGITPGSSRKVWWECSGCSHGWEASIYNRVNGKNCPTCSNGSVSPISQRWLDSLGGKNVRREYYVRGLNMRVDGFDPETNIVYEFLGDYWHGNPQVYDGQEMNERVGKTYGRLHEETYQRFRLLEEAGYKVVYIWEKDFRCLRARRYLNE